MEQFSILVELNHIEDTEIYKGSETKKVGLEELFRMVLSGEVQFHNNLMPDSKRGRQTKAKQGKDGEREEENQEDQSDSIVKSFEQLEVTMVSSMKRLKSRTPPANLKGDIIRQTVRDMNRFKRALEKSIADSPHHQETSNNKPNDNDAPIADSKDADKDYEAEASDDDSNENNRAATLETRATTTTTSTTRRRQDRGKQVGNQVNNDETPETAKKRSPKRKRAPKSTGKTDHDGKKKDGNRDTSDNAIKNVKQSSPKPKKKKKEDENSSAKSTPRKRPPRRQAAQK